MKLYSQSSTSMLATDDRNGGAGGHIPTPPSKLEAWGGGVWGRACTFLNEPENA